MRAARSSFQAGLFWDLTMVYALVMASGTRGTVSPRKEGGKPPFEVPFAVWALMAAIAVMDILGGQPHDGADG